MQPLKGAEQLVGVAHVKARPVVLDKVNQLAVRRGLAAHQNLAGRLARGEFPGVGQQIFKHLPQQRAIALHRQAGLHRELGHTRRIALLQAPENAQRDAAQIDLLVLERGARDLRQRQQRIGELTHLLDTCTDAAQVMRRPLADVSGQRLLQQGAEAVDRIQRRTQVVRHRIRKSLKLFVGRFKLGGAAQHPTFQIDIEADNFLLRTLEVGDIRDGRDEARQSALRIVEQRLHVGQHPKHPAVGSFIAQHIMPGLASAQRHGRRSFFLREHRAVLAGELPGGVKITLALHFGQALAHQALGAQVAIDNVGVAVAQHHAFGQGRHDRAKTGFAGMQGCFGAAALGDVAANAAVAGELTGSVKDRLAADADCHQLLVVVIALVFKIMKSLVPFELLAMVLPGRLFGLQALDLPARLAQVGGRGHVGVAGITAGHRDEAQFFILLPVPV